MTAVVGVEGYHILQTNEATTWRQARSGGMAWQGEAAESGQLDTLGLNAT
jgi:hypothetical protein